MKQMQWNDKFKGHYSVGLNSGIIPAALTANSEIVQFRNSHASKKMAIKKISFSAAVSTTMFAAGVPLKIQLFKSTAWSVAGTGGTGLTPAAMLKMNTGMPSTAMAADDVRVATTAALGAGTKTLETVPLRTLVAACPITASLNGVIFNPSTMLFEADVPKYQDQNDNYPLVLGYREGLSIVVAAVPATGTWEAACNIEWCELEEIG